MSWELYTSVSVSGCEGITQQRVVANACVWTCAQVNQPSGCEGISQQAGAALQIRVVAWPLLFLECRCSGPLKCPCTRMSWSGVVFGHVSHDIPCSASADVMMRRVYGALLVAMLAVW